MAEAGGLLLLKKKPEDFPKTPAEGEDPEVIVPNAGMKKGTRERETHHFPKQAPKAGRGGEFLNPTQEVWRGLWACRVLRHLETLEAEAATWAGWGEMGPLSSHSTSNRAVAKPEGKMRNTCNFTARGLAR